MIEKLLSVLLKKPIDWVNEKTAGYKTYAAALVLILPGLACVIAEMVKEPLTLERILAIWSGEGAKQIAAGLAVWGFRAKK